MRSLYKRPTRFFLLGPKTIRGRDPKFLELLLLSFSSLHFNNPKLLYIKQTSPHIANQTSRFFSISLLTVAFYCAQDGSGEKASSALSEHTVKSASNSSQSDLSEESVDLFSQLRLGNHRYRIEFFATPLPGSRIHPVARNRNTLTMTSNLHKFLAKANIELARAKEDWKREVLYSPL